MRSAHPEHGLWQYPLQPGVSRQALAAMLCAQAGAKLLEANPVKPKSTHMLSLTPSPSVRVSLSACMRPDSTTHLVEGHDHARVVVSRDVVVVLASPPSSRVAPLAQGRAFLHVQHPLSGPGRATAVTPLVLGTWACCCIWAHTLASS